MSRLDAALELVHISSVSHSEAALADHIEKKLAECSHLDVTRIGDNVIARTEFGRSDRLLVAGHLDTVPGESEKATITGEILAGVGACDMKGSLSVMLELAIDPTPRSVDVTWVFYAREEIARSESGLLEIANSHPELLQADAAVLGEPTNGIVEAGCQGNLRIQIVLSGVRAHTARPFTGRNAIHRLAPLIEKISSYEPRHVVIDGVQYVEQLQAVLVSGGIAGNVVPNEVSLTINHRFAPDRSAQEATAWLQTFVGGLLEETDSFSVLDAAPSAAPMLKNTHLERLVGIANAEPVGKVGWTDVATFQELGVPATNFGAGDPLLAHRSDEFVTLSELDVFAERLAAWLA